MNLVKNNLKVDISQVIEQTLEQTETGGAFQSGFASHGMASYRRENEKSAEKKDLKYMTSQSGKSPYPVLNTGDLAQTYEELKAQGTKSSRVTRAGEEPETKLNSQMSFLPNNQYQNQGI